jgi:hypothetical protein
MPLDEQLVGSLLSIAIALRNTAILPIQKQ